MDDTSSSSSPTSENGFELEQLGEQGPASTGPRMLVPLFLVPLVIVVLVVGLVLGIQALIGHQETPRELLSRVQTGGVNDRWQAAAALTEIARTDPSQLAEPGLREGIRSAFEAAGTREPALRQYLAGILGSIGDRKAAGSVLRAAEEALAARAAAGGVFPGRDPVETGREFLAFVHCLGMLGDPTATDFLLGLADDGDDGVRKATAAALGQLYLPAVQEGQSAPAEVMEGLLRLHEDPDPWVRMNAALSLAKLGNPAAVPTLELMLDREHLRKHNLRFPDQGEYTVSGHDPAFAPIESALASIRWLAEVSSDREAMAAPEGPLVKALERVAAQDPNALLRSHAEEVLGALREPSGGGS